MLLEAHALFTHVTIRCCHSNKTNFAMLIGQERSKVG